MSIMTIESRLELDSTEIKANQVLEEVVEGKLILARVVVSKQILILYRAQVILIPIGEDNR